MSEELKPCPFCGGKAEASSGPGTTFCSVHCFDCGVAMDAIKPAHYLPRVIAAWNRRTESSELSAAKASITEKDELLAMIKEKAAKSRCRDGCGESLGGELNDTCDVCCAFVDIEGMAVDALASLPPSPSDSTEDKP